MNISTNWKKTMLAAAAGALFLGNQVAQATPHLQLDISDGIYRTEDQTVVAQGDAFTLYAIIDTGDPAFSENATYYISMAVVPKLQQTDPDPVLGSITVGGSTINVTEDMQYGTPPIAEATTTTEGSSDLPSHGAFETYWYEWSFHEINTYTVEAYDTAVNPGGPTSCTSGANCDHRAYNLAIDVANLAEGYGIHFDLYTKNVTDGVTQIASFAPFSHDAQTGNGIILPEPSMALIFGSGMLLMGAGMRRRVVDA